MPLCAESEREKNHFSEMRLGLSTGRNPLHGKRAGALRVDQLDSELNYLNGNVCITSKQDKAAPLLLVLSMSSGLKPKVPPTLKYYQGA